MAIFLYPRVQYNLQKYFKACFHYLTSFDDLDGFTGVNRQMKYSADMRFV